LKQEPGLPRVQRFRIDRSKILDLGTLESSYLPGDLSRDLPGEWREEVHGHWHLRVRVRSFHPTQEAVEQIARRLRVNRESLRATPIRDVVKLFDRLAQRWLKRGDPVRRKTILAIAAVTGFSPEMVAHSIDLEQESSRAPHLLRALTQELGAPEAIDEFTPNTLLGGRSRAIGPDLVGAIFSANVPGLPHLEVMRSYLLKAACLGKIASAEPLFLAAYARTMEKENRDLAECMAVISLDRDDSAGRRALLRSVDHLVAYGGPEAVRTLMAEAPDGLPATWHGHRLGFAAVLSGAITGKIGTKVAEALAYDFSLFDQQACLAPAALYVETTNQTELRQFASAIATAMERWAAHLPPRQLSVRESAARRGWLDERKIDGAEVVAAPPGLPYVVLIDTQKVLEPSLGDRLVRIIPLPTIDALFEHLKPMRRHLQCAAVAGDETRVSHVANRLAELGVSRMTRPGLMGLPTMMWRHDGTGCLSSMVRFCDQETLPPREIRTEPASRLDGGGPSELRTKMTDAKQKGEHARRSHARTGPGN
jgi:hypothetical protein